MGVCGVLVHQPESGCLKTQPSGVGVMLAQPFCPWLKHTCASGQPPFPWRRLPLTPGDLHGIFHLLVFFVDVTIPVSMKAPRWFRVALGPL